MPDKMTHAANVAVGKEIGLVPMAAWTSSEDEWDEFEWTYQRIIEQHAADTPDDENVITKLARRREWMDAYLKWGLCTGQQILNQHTGRQTHHLSPVSLTGTRNDVARRVNRPPNQHGMVDGTLTPVPKVGIGFFALPQQSASQSDGFVEIYRE
jgi:hypothetical protein